MEAGENPAWTRHCDRGCPRQQATGAFAGAGKAPRGRPVSQETRSDRQANSALVERVALMNRTKLIGTAVAAVAFALAPMAASASTAPYAIAKVTVRVEGKTKTLLAAKDVTTSSGYITKDGAPATACPAESAQGALDAATHGSWSGTWDSSYDDYFVTKILGETESGARYYWEVFVNNVAAPTGPCEIVLHGGDQLLFAAVSSTGAAEYPLAVKLLSKPAAGKGFKVEVLGYNAKGKAKALAGASVSLSKAAAGKTVKTSARGVATLTAPPSGKLTINATKAGFIRAETSASLS
jgi:hypothetical protein